MKIFIWISLFIHVGLLLYKQNAQRSEQFPHAKRKINISIKTIRKPQPGLNDYNFNFNSRKGNHKRYSAKNISDSNINNLRSKLDDTIANLAFHLSHGPAGHTICKVRREKKITVSCDSSSSILKDLISRKLRSAYAFKKLPRHGIVKVIIAHRKSVGRIPIQSWSTGNTLAYEISTYGKGEGAINKVSYGVTEILKAITNPPAYIFELMK